MVLDEQELRLEGVYKQNNRGEYMLRIKLAGGILSVSQARALATLGENFGNHSLHLSTRGSIEFHRLLATDLSEVYRGLSAVGLFSRGACGGAVRGISCSSSFGPGFERTQVMLRHFLQHFSGNPHFEGLPKKFKIAFEAGYERSRHLIQDLGLVLVEEQGEDSLYDVWIAGGLGREPQAGILFAERVIESELLPLAEAIIEVYKEWGEKGRRLKHMLNDIGEEALRLKIAESIQNKQPVRFKDAFPKTLLPDGRSLRIPLEIIAGELPAAKLMRLVALAAAHGSQWFLVTPDQNIELLIEDDASSLQNALNQAGFVIAPEGGALRVCPGNHECRMGLCATRDLAQRIQLELGEQISLRSLGISGCRNSCAQPQLAEFGVLASKLKTEAGAKLPLFDLFQRTGTGLGTIVANDLREDELVTRLGVLIAEK